jgi:hypothetical protein
MTVREPECVAIKRRGAEHVTKLLAGKTPEEQLDFWQRRTEALLAKQARAKSHSPKVSPKEG